MDAEQHAATLRLDALTSAIVQVAKEMQTPSADQPAALKQLEEKLQLSTKTIQEQRKADLETKFQNYKEPERTKESITNDYELHRKGIYDTAVAQYHAANANLQPGAPTPPVPIMPYEVSQLFVHKGLRLFGYNPTTSKLHEEVLEYSHEIRLGDFKSCIHSYDFSGNTDLYRTVLSFLSQGAEYGLTKAQLALLFQDLIKEKYKESYSGVKHVKNPEKVFKFLLSLINFSGLTLRATAALKSITRTPQQDLTSVVHQFVQLRQELYTYEFPTWTPEYCEEKAQNAGLSVLKDLIEQPTYEELKLFKEALKRGRERYNLNTLLTFLEKKELKPGFELRSVKSLKQFDPFSHSDQPHMPVKVDINAVESIYGTRSKGNDDLRRLFPVGKDRGTEGRRSASGRPTRSRDRRPRDPRSRERRGNDRSSSTSSRPTSRSMSRERHTGRDRNSSRDRPRQPTHRDQDRHRSQDRNRYNRSASNGPSSSRSDRNRTPTGDRSFRSTRDRSNSAYRSPGRASGRSDTRSDGRPSGTNRYQGRSPASSYRPDRRRSNSAHDGRRDYDRRRDHSRDRQRTYQQDRRRNQRSTSFNRNRTPSRDTRYRTPTRDDRRDDRRQRSPSTDRLCEKCAGPHRTSNCLIYRNRAPNICNICYTAYHYRADCVRKNSRPETTRFSENSTGRQANLQ